MNLEEIYNKLNARNGKTKSNVSTVVVTGAIVAGGVMASCSSCSSGSPECIYAGPLQMGVSEDTLPMQECVYAGPTEMSGEVKNEAPKDTCVVRGVRDDDDRYPEDVYAGPTEMP